MKPHLFKELQQVLSCTTNHYSYYSCSLKCGKRNSVELLIHRLLLEEGATTSMAVQCHFCSWHIFAYVRLLSLPTLVCSSISLHGNAKLGLCRSRMWIWIWFCQENVLQILFSSASQSVPRHWRSGSRSRCWDRWLHVHLHRCTCIVGSVLDAEA